MTKERLGNFGDYEGGSIDVDEWKELDDLVNQDVIIHETAERDGKFSRYLLLKMTTSKKPKDFFGVQTGAAVIVKKVDKAEADGNLPCEGQIIQLEGKDYFDIIAPGGTK